jgi:hypothetical protein
MDSEQFERNKCKMKSNSSSLLFLDKKELCSPHDVYRMKAQITPQNNVTFFFKKQPLD